MGTGHTKDRTFPHVRYLTKNRTKSYQNSWILHQKKSSKKTKFRDLMSEIKNHEKRQTNR